ncbi:hypothetical protein [Azospirillum griseum]|uniref:VWFA domain-containing protein n=1 Tax=Azospirillum griseum TaxID=2496639 RepID=A0A431VDA5_9PROT|nr:hypothetical protein [Azospirillum griseum]RTR17070.1 hypothetical protein EJ903_19085 [Azospirillum griseum]
MVWIVRWVVCLVLAVLAVTDASAQSAATSPEAVADSQTLPPIDLLVYVDRSKTIYTGTGSSAPNARIVTMLSKMFDQPIDDGRRPFIAANDKVYLHSFGATPAPVVPAIDAGDRNALKAGVAALNTSVTPDTKTDFRTLIEAIYKNDVLTTSDNRLKIVLIASDFIDDPNDNATNAEKTGVCDLLETYRKSGATRIPGDIRELRRAFGGAAATNSWKPFMGLLLVEPTRTDFAGLGAQYQKCLLDTVQDGPMHKTIANAVGAVSIRFSEVANDADRFARDFVTEVYRASQPGVQIDASTSLCTLRGGEGSCSLEVSNRSRLPIRIQQFKFQASQGNDVLFTAASDLTLAPNAQQSIRIGLTTDQIAKFPSGEAIQIVAVDTGKHARPATGVPIKRLQGLSLTKAAIEYASGGSGQREVVVTVTNPNPETLSVKELLFYGDGNITGPRERLSITGPDAVLPGGARDRSLRYPLPVGLAQLANSKLTVAATDTLTGVTTDRRPLEPPPPLRPLEIKKAQVQKSGASGQGEYLLTLSVDNPGPVENGISQLVFTSNLKRGWRARREAETAERIAAGGSVTTRLRLNMDRDSEIIEGRDILLTCVDVRQEACSDMVSVELPKPESLDIGKNITWVSSDKGGPPSLRFTLRNPGSVPVTVNGVQVAKGSDRERLPTTTKPTINPGTEETLTVPYKGGTDFLQRFHPNDTVFLQVECAEADCSGERERVPGLPNVTLTLEETRPSLWKQGVSVPELALTVSSTVDFTNWIGGVWASTDERGGATAYKLTLEPPPAQIPPNGRITFPATFQKLPNDLLTGADVFVCVAGYYEFGVSAPDFRCPADRWSRVALPSRAPVVVVPDSKSFDRNASQLRLKVRNPNAVPTVVSAVVLAGDTKRDHVFRLTRQSPLVVGADREADLTMALTDEQVKELEKNPTIKAAVIDSTNPSATNNGALDTRGVEISTEHYSVRITDAALESRWELSGSFPFVTSRSIVSAVIVTTRSSPTSPPVQKISVGLSGVGMDGVPGPTKRMLDVTFQRLEAEKTVSWLLPLDHDIKGPIDVTAFHDQGADTPSLKTASPKILSKYTPWIGHMVVFFIGSMFVSGFVYLRYKTKYFKIPESIEIIGRETLKKIVEYVNIAGVLSFIGTAAPIIGAWLTGGPIAAAAMFLFSFILVMFLGVVAGGGHAGWRHRQLKRMVETGSPAMPYPLAASAAKKSLTRWMYGLGAAAFVLGLVFAVSNVPLHQRPGVELIEL